MAVTAAIAIAAPATALRGTKPVRCDTPPAWTQGSRAYADAAQAEGAFLARRADEHLPGPGRWIHMPDYVYTLPGAVKSLSDASTDVALFLGEGAVWLGIALVQAGIEDPPSCDLGQR